MDRVEGSVAVLIADDDERRADVPIERLPADTAPGVVLRVPGPDAEPRWDRATSDEELRRARLREATETLDRLRRRDPGGDIEL